MVARVYSQKIFILAKMIISKQDTFPLHLNKAYYFPALPYSWKETTITHRNSISVLHNAAEGEVLS